MGAYLHDLWTVVTALAWSWPAVALALSVAGATVYGWAESPRSRR